MFLSFNLNECRLQVVKLVEQVYCLDISCSEMLR